MSTTEPVPLETVCTSEQGEQVQLLPPREVPLGGPRAMPVRRVLPQRKRSLIGSWCFLDAYGPDDVSETGGMTVARHPHTGLATVSWLFTGQIDHLDSAGNAAVVRPGEVNLMLAGRGITHQECSTRETTTLHGIQLWYALPQGARGIEHGFQHYAPEAVEGPGTQLRVFIGSLAGSTSPVRTHTPPLLGAELSMKAGSRIELELDPGFEHGLYLDGGSLSSDGMELPEAHLAYFGPGRSVLRLAADQGPDVSVLLLGGEPLGEQIVMWWNLIGRSHEEIVAYRAIYQHEIGAEGPPPAELLEAAGLTEADLDRFGPFPEDQPAPLPAPPLPTTRLKTRA